MKFDDIRNYINGIHFKQLPEKSKLDKHIKKKQEIGNVKQQLKKEENRQEFRRLIKIMGL